MEIISRVVPKWSMISEDRRARRRFISREIYRIIDRRELVGVRVRTFALSKDRASVCVYMYCVCVHTHTFRADAFFRSRTPTSLCFPQLLARTVYSPPPRRADSPRNLYLPADLLCYINRPRRGAR